MHQWLIFMYARKMFLSYVINLAPLLQLVSMFLFFFRSAQAAVVAVEQAKKIGIKNLILHTDSNFLINGLLFNETCFICTKNIIIVVLIA